MDRWVDMYGLINRQTDRSVDRWEKIRSGTGYRAQDLQALCADRSYQLSYPDSARTLLLLFPFGLTPLSLPSKETLRGHSDSSFRGEGYIQCCVGVRLCDMYSNQELAEIHFMYGKADGNTALARRLYLERYPQRQCPDRKTFVRLHYLVRFAGTWIEGFLIDRWIGRGGPIAWPPRSPDLNPLDFYLWGRLKSLVYSSPVPDLESLRNRIVACSEDIRNTPGVWDRVRRSMRHRCESRCRKNEAETDQEEKKELTGSLAEKKLPTEECIGRNGGREFGAEEDIIC
ncbi:hypothetical protein ANN_27086 [Periplaneta americana]|uniref:DUF4817 domain-containing protein n=1 Tax=Periplaneta americana TaxID=6978 RepID=A0ABQ8RX87_PERAM|nr:hypothetical protein ANN_27086 [Periplaneta americana]